MFIRKTVACTRPAAFAGLRRCLSSDTPTIVTRLKADLKTAMKEKDKVRLPVIKGILSDIMYAEKSPASSPTFSTYSDADVATVIQRVIRRRHESITSFVDGGRPELAEAEKIKIAILEQYLPQQLTAEQIEARAKDVIRKLGASGAKAIGPVMRDIGISPAEASKARVAEIVKKLLTGSS
ncbi:Yqey-like protein-domain-containing protein [Coemansia mojavensis]|nr:Yqey-like protein-domain-containing protein [Coemansia mojavensis]